MPFSQSLEFDNIPIKAQDFYCIEYYFHLFLENILKHFRQESRVFFVNTYYLVLILKRATNLLGV